MQPGTSEPRNQPAIAWPDGKAFAFTIFDDPDAQTVKAGREVYSFLQDLGFRTTKGVWPLDAVGPSSCIGESCADPEYLSWCIELQDHGFEIGYHNASQNTADRVLTRQGLDRFEAMFGASPATMSNHYNSEEGIYWGDVRLSGSRRLIYNAATRFANHRRFWGHVKGHPLYWGDLCRDRIRYVRNFVYPEINTLRACPWMPYHDPDRSLVAQWYASSEGSDCSRFVATLSEANQDRLLAERGACIMYTHFGHGYYQNGKLDSRFRDVMTRLSRMNGWFVPVRTLLDHVQAVRGPHVLTSSERATVEWRWLMQKIRHGTS